MNQRLDDSIFGDRRPRSGPPTRRARRQTVMARRRRRPRRMLTGIVALLVVLGGCLVAWKAVGPMAGQLLGGSDYEGQGNGAVDVTIREGDSLSAVGQSMQEADVVKSSGAFVDAMEHQNAQVHPGTFTMRKQMSGAAAAAMLMGGANRNEAKVVVKEGMWKSEIFDALATATGTPRGDYTQVERTAQQQPETIGLPPVSRGAMEGYLYPATYSFAKGTTAQQQLRTIVEKTVSSYRAAGVSDDNLHKVLTTASIVEAEARQDADRPKVARVLLNRVARKMPLQLDSTVSYGIQKRRITTEHNERGDDGNKYNTYRHYGLPPGPIGNPGMASVRAALEPASGTWLYFVATNPDTGETVFSNTFAEHQKAVSKFQAWCRARPGTC